MDVTAEEWPRKRISCCKQLVTLLTTYFTATRTDFRDFSYIDPNFDCLLIEKDCSKSKELIFSTKEKRMILSVVRRTLDGLK